MFYYYGCNDNCLICDFYYKLYLNSIKKTLYTEEMLLLTGQDSIIVSVWIYLR